MELAIFGSILITLLGVLISYGLRYNYQQLTMQRAFRKSLQAAAASMEPGTPTATSITLIEDHHIPDPANQFGVGSMVPFSGSGSVTRSAAMQMTPDNVAELSATVYNINGEILTFRNGEFREAFNVDANAMIRYLEIYGTMQAWNTTLKGGLGDWAYWEDGTKTCIEEGETDPWTNTTPCLLWSYNRIRYIDDVAGEIMSEESAKRQCRRIIDSQVCEHECRRSGGSTCENTCAQQIEIPWYCGNDYEEIDADNHIYIFPFLDTMFAFSKEINKNMGLQVTGNLQEDSTVASSIKTEDEHRAQNLDDVQMNTHSERKIVTKTYGDTTTNTNIGTVASDTQRRQNYIWRTPWD